MPPRKAADAPTAEPRRSGRIASQPSAPSAEPAAPKKPKAPKTGKKRSAEDLGEGKEDEASAAKKAKAGTAEETTKDEAEGNSAAPSPKLEIGDALPDLVLQNEKGEDIKVAELAAEKGVVLFLVPKANTPGCNTQACGFRDIYPDFSSLNYTVYCLSADSPNAQNKWQISKELPYPLLSDPKRTLITALGAGEGGKTKRSHFIFEKGGKLVEKKLPVSPTESPKLALEFIKKTE